ncbi:MAG: RluA family pseudouridine synthase [Fidelibacterota bacterium]
MKRLQFHDAPDGVRLDKFLADSISELSRTKLNQLIRSGTVRVNGAVEKPSYQLTPDDKITIIYDKDEDHSTQPEPQDIPLDILYEDDAIIVVNKPPGLVVHPGAGQRDKTLVNGLLFHFKTLSNLNGENRPGIIHRLDKDTSGVILVAKTNLAHRRIAEQFEQRMVEKVYTGITWGEWQEGEGTICEPIGRNRSDPTTFSVQETGRSAITAYKVDFQSRYLSKVLFYPKTGRTHQIRVHANWMHHPIFGDEKYGGGLNRIKGFMTETGNILKKLINYGRRHALHATTISFMHPDTGEKLSFSAPIPNDMKMILDTMEHDGKI